MFDVVMPLHAGKGDKLDLLRAAVSIQSFVRSGTIELVDQFHVIHPRGHSALLQGLRAISPKVACTAEEDMFSPGELIAIRTGIGWRRQQFVKLAANRLSDARVLLTCDADVTALRCIDPDEIFYKKQLRMQRGKQFDEWVRDSFALFDAAIPEKLMSVTPIFLTREGLEVVQHMLDRPRRGWIERLVEAERRGQRWTEYMVYQAANVAADSWDRLHVFVKPNALAQGIWRNHVPDAARIDPIKADSPPFFVYQSVREDFFLAQDLMAGFGLPNSADIPPDKRGQVERSLLHYHEAERFWAAHLVKEFGLFQSRFFDLVQLRVTGHNGLRNSDAFEAAAILLFIAISQIEKLDQTLAPKQLIAMAIARMQAQPFMVALIETDPRFDALIDFMLKPPQTIPDGLDRILYTAEISRKMLALILQRMMPRHAVLAVDLAVSRARYMRPPQSKTVFKMIEQLIGRGDFGHALKLLRMALRKYEERHAEVLVLAGRALAAAGKPMAAAAWQARANGSAPGAIMESKA